MSESETRPFLEINQNLVIGLAIAASILAIVLYYENKKMREQLGMLAARKPCNCQDQQIVTEVTHSPIPSSMPTSDKPPEVVVD